MSREEILKKLESHAWYLATDHNIAMEIQTLPEDHDGYLEDLANRPEQIGDLKVHKIVALKRGYSAIITIFEVSRPPIDKSYIYEYVSWKNGPLSGAKGLVLILDLGGKISKFLLFHGNKFAVGGDVFDVPGGFASVDEKGVSGMLNRFKKELQEELGLPSISVKVVHDLGKVFPDAGMTNNHPQLFVAIIDARQAEQIGQFSNPDPQEVELGPTVLPIEKLREIVIANDDAYFHILVTRAIARGILSPSVLSP
jgi:hypothetical protein